MSENISLMADIGGTNTRVALGYGSSVDQSSIQRFRNSEHSGLEQVLHSYLSVRPDVTPDAAAAAIAGPVHNGKGTLTNLDWTVDRDLLTRVTGAKTVSVINDLQAQGHALEYLTEDKTRLIKAGGDAKPNASLLVVGVGTGFNAAAVFRTASETLVPPAEAGHADLPTPTEELRSFAKYFNEKHGFCSVEDILSGRGLGHLYRWHSGVELPAAEIMKAHVDGSDANATATVMSFGAALGTVVGNLALTILPFGGIYLVGGVSQAIAPFLNDNGFTSSFCDKGRFSEFMDQFPVRVVEDDYAALTGMAALLDEVRNGPPRRT
jgi:glucokinase